VNVQQTVTIVMPAYNAAHHLPKVIPAALNALKGGRLIVVDPGSSDDTAALAERLGAEVVRLGHRAGPALARNRGVELVTTPVTLFIDSDCVAHANVVDKVASAFANDPNLVTLTGSYDDTPPEQNFFSQYMNLRHHFTHQRAKTEGASFWAGCGAVRTDAFRAVGGFDAEQFPMPMIEDIELGVRLQPLGRTSLDPRLHVTHLKRWSGMGVITTDIFSRAVPWSRLILRSGKLPNDLNLAWKQRVAAGLAPFSLLALLVIPGALLFAAWPLAAAAAVPLCLSAWLHQELFRFFRTRRGAVAAFWTVVFHQVHLTYSAVTMVVETLRHRFGS
jgi:glycosyltransferase involved in cell wall biosynthesis